MAEIRPDQYQNRDKQKDVEIKRDVKLYITKSYVIEVFLCNSMFNPMTTFPASWFEIPEFDMLIYEVLCHLKRHDLNLSMTKLASCIFTMWSSCAGQTCYLRTCKTEKFSCRQENTHCQAFFQNSFSSLLSILVGDSRDFWIHILKHFHILFCWSIVFLSSWC